MLSFRKPVALVALPLMVSAWIFGTAGASFGATIVVDSLADDMDLGPNGTCTLREAVAAANTNAAVDACAAGDAGADTIAVPSGTIALTIAGTDDASGDLDLLEDAAIEGTGFATTIVDATGLGDRVVEVAAGATVEIAGLSLVGGTATGATTGVPGQGGGVLNRGTLTLRAVRVAGNRAKGGANILFNGAEGHGEGGGVRNLGSLTVLQSVIEDNVAEGGDGGTSDFGGSFYSLPGGEGRGGGIHSSGPLSILRSSLVGNLARGGRGVDYLDFGAGFGRPVSGGGPARGGALLSEASAEIVECEVSANTARGGVAGAGNGLLPHVTGGTGGAATGGGIVSTAALTVERSTVDANVAEGSGGGGASGNAGAASAGGIAAEGAEAVRLSESTVSRNRASGGTGADGFLLQIPPYNWDYAGGTGGSASAGGMRASAPTEITNATIALNRTTAGAGGANRGVPGSAASGALLAAGAVDLLHVTVAANQGGAPELVATGALSVGNSIVSDDACAGFAGASLGGNVESPGDTCALDQSRDRPAASAAQLALGALASNGGPTETNAIDPTSVAIDNGEPAICAAVDQRGISRPAGACDAGAYERTLCIDADGDGYGAPGSNGCAQEGVDCDDTNPAVHPGATEIPGNGVDDDCDPATPVGCQPESVQAAVAASGAPGPVELPLDGATELALGLALAWWTKRRR